jgi:hypothetical protein
MMTTLRKKILLVLLRHNQGGIPNIFWSTMDVRIDRRSTGLNAREIAYYVSYNRLIDKYKYERALLRMKDEGLVTTSKSKQYRCARLYTTGEFILTNNGIKVAKEIEKDIKDMVLQWQKITEMMPPIDDEWYKEIPGIKKDWNG